MSGGSYNYLHGADADDLLSGKSADLARMAERLAGLDYAEDAARETEELILIVRQFRIRAEARMERLAGVWHAVEWWDSCDYSEDQVKQALAKYRGEA